MKPIKIANQGLVGIRIRWFLIAAFSLWMSAILVGFAALRNEQFTPIADHGVLSSFPRHSTIQSDKNLPMLIMFVHPYCPCTRASLHELGKIVEDARNKLSVVLVFTISEGLPPDWKQEDLWISAIAMPGVRMVEDKGGVEARRFGVAGSGHALLYDTAGKLLFSGGVTGSRGHEGPNPGRSAVVSFVLAGHAPADRTPVFGCSLL